MLNALLAICLVGHASAQLLCNGYSQLCNRSYGVLPQGGF